VRPRRKTWLAALAVGCAAIATASAGTLSASAARSTSATPLHATAPETHWCNTDGVTCVEPLQNWDEFPFYKKVRSEGVNLDEYIGHDEPSVLFNSSTPGSGNDNLYNLTLPKDPPVQPTQDGSGGTDNFQLRPAFWFGMAMCDDQSAPNPTYSGSPYPNTTCTPDSDSNIRTGDDPTSPDYIGKAPGGGYMEMQFYPPGWVKWPAGISCDPTRWCAALNIDSLSENSNTGVANNAACLNSAGVEPANFAFLTKNGQSTTPANALNPGRFTLSPSKDFFMRSGDKLSMHMFDTAAGFTVQVNDLTTGTTGSMVASQANGFASVKFDPSASSCSLVPHGFHPMFSTSNTGTRLMWTAHTYNVAMSDEIGHFEYCSKINPNNLSCKKSGGFDSNNPDPEDDQGCFPTPAFPSSRVQVGGCIASDTDFDGVPYDAKAWPGSISNSVAGKLLTSTPVTFTSPTTVGGANFDSASFENDLPRIEDFRPDSPYGGVQFNCQRHIANPADPNPGQHCVGSPPQARDYPFFVTTRTASGGCAWQEVGGVHVSGILKAFGGNSTRAYGNLLNAHYPAAPAGTVEQVYDTFHRNLTNNPCRG